MLLTGRGFYHIASGVGEQTMPGILIDTALNYVSYRLCSGSPHMPVVLIAGHTGLAGQFPISRRLSDLRSNELPRH